jgi:hypothetical protein
MRERAVDAYCFFLFSESAPGKHINTTPAPTHREIRNRSEACELPAIP